MRHTLWFITCIVYLIFFKNFIFNSGATQSLSFFFAVILIIVFSLKKEKFITTKSIIGMTILPVIFISLNELVLKEILTVNIFDDALFSAQRYRNQFFYMLCFLALPTVLFFIKFKIQHFFNIIIISTLMSVGFNTYTNIKLNFNRELLIDNLSPIIMYDYGVIAISLLLVCYGFYLKDKKSYIIITLSLINIFLIVLHGSRGAWLGLPIAFVMIFIFYWKNNTKKILTFTSLPLILLLFSLTLIPNSPIQNRFQLFFQDKEKIIESNNYNSSVGGRLLVGQIAFFKFKEAPFLGIGMAQFQRSNEELYKKGILGHKIPHAHNVYLQALVSQGFLGLISILFLFLAPLIFFIRNNNLDNKNIYFLSVSGIVFISYIMICSLVDLYFGSKPVTTLYYLVVVTLISLILKEKTK